MGYDAWVAQVLKQDQSGMFQVNKLLKEEQNNHGEEVPDLVPFVEHNPRSIGQRLKYIDDALGKFKVDYNAKVKDNVNDIASQTDNPQKVEKEFTVDDAIAYGKSNIEQLDRLSYIFKSLIVDLYHPQAKMSAEQCHQLEGQLKIFHQKFKEHVAGIAKTAAQAENEASQASANLYTKVFLQEYQDLLENNHDIKAYMSFVDSHGVYGKYAINQAPRTRVNRTGGFKLTGSLYGDQGKRGTVDGGTNPLEEEGNEARKYPGP